MLNGRFHSTLGKPGSLGLSPGIQIELRLLINYGLQMKESKNDYRDRLSKISQDQKRRSTEG